MNRICMALALIAYVALPNLASAQVVTWNPDPPTAGSKKSSISVKGKVSVTVVEVLVFVWADGDAKPKAGVSIAPDLNGNWGPNLVYPGTGKAGDKYNVAVQAVYKKITYETVRTGIASATKDGSCDPSDLFSVRAVDYGRSSQRYLGSQHCILAKFQGNHEKFHNIMAAPTAIDCR